MKTLLKNKKMISGLVATTLGVAILVMSLSLAWFSSGGNSTTTITLGELVLTGQLYSLGNDVDQNYPGTEYYFDRTGWIKKDGNLTAFAQLDFNVFVKQHPAYGNWEGYANEWFAINEEGVPGIAHPLGVWIGDNVDYTWWKGADNKYYVDMFGNDKLHFVYDLTIPTWLGNAFQAAQVSVNFTWNGVQRDPYTAAIVDYFVPIVPEMENGWIDEGFGLVPGPIIKGSTDPVTGAGEPFFELLPGLVIDPPVDGLNPPGDGTTFSTFSSPDALAILQDYVDALADDDWVKSIFCAQFGLDF